MNPRLPIPTMKSSLTWSLILGGAELCALDGRSSISNGGRSGGSMAAGFSLESEEQYAEDKHRGVIMEPISLEHTPWLKQLISHCL